MISKKVNNRTLIKKLIIVNNRPSLFWKKMRKSANQEELRSHLPVLSSPALIKSVFTLFSHICYLFFVYIVSLYRRQQLKKGYLMSKKHNGCICSIKKECYKAYYLFTDLFTAAVNKTDVMRRLN